MKPIKIVSTQDPKTLIIRWDPNNICNYKCNYCWPDSNAGTYHSLSDIDLIIKNFNHFIKQYKENLGKDKIQIKMGGGEPTLWKDLDIFIREIKRTNDVYFTLISNGSRTIRWWKEHGHLIDDAHLSYHIDQADVDHMISVADILFEYNKKVTVKILLNKQNWDKGLEVLNYMKQHSKHQWFIQVVEIVEHEVLKLGNIKIVNADDVTLNQDQKKFLKNSLKRIPNLLWWWKNKNLLLNGQTRFYESVVHLDNDKKIKATAQTYINNNWNNFEGWKCNIGLDDVYIDWAGDIKGACQQTIYSLDYSFNILDKNFIETFKPKFESSICSKKNCFCVPENHISKFKLS